jgi:hypothetical protein
MRLTSTGLGIGTSSPATKLDVNGDSTFRNGAGTIIGTISNASGWYQFGSSTNVNGVQLTSATATPIRFLPAGTEAMRLDSSGNLGIGTSSPSVSLQVGNASGLRQVLVSGGGYDLVLGASGGSIFGFTSQAISTVFNTSAVPLGVGTSGSQPLILGTANTERMRLDSSGNLGLGVTPSAWNSGAKTFQLTSTPAFWSFSNNLYLSNNRFFDTGGSNKYITNGFATTYEQSSGQHIWLTAPSGTAGNAISFTQAMTLDASGRLAVGSTSVTNGTAFGGGGQVNVAKLASSGYPCLQISTTTGSGSSVQFTNSDTVNGVIGYNASGGTNEFTVNNALSGALTFGTNNTERARIDSSGNLLVGHTLLSYVDYAGIEARAEGTLVSVNKSGNLSGVFTVDTDRQTIAFFRSTTQVGSISVTTTATAYNTSSDQRLKENIEDAESASSLIDSLQVRQYDWKANGEHQRYGFVAQELVTVAPEAVHQPADPEEMMAVDYSKLVPMLVKEIQSLRARVAALESI